MELMGSVFDGLWWVMAGAQPSAAASFHSNNSIPFVVFASAALPPFSFTAVAPKED